ncbi:hypothetical protein JL722_1289 [Aureococcus anophagefferens]|nr:hypothetical protein JL722_1289 [Aureococcus anophagefferens]
MDLYTDVAQKRREVLFVEHAGVSAQLERWWQAAFLYLDKDWNEHLDWEEYKEFHKRLMRLLEGADEMTPQEAEETMRADFTVDAGDDGLVSHEEFRYAVFQLADTWTVSLDGDEYVEFLSKSFDVGAMVKTALNEAKTTNAISEIIVAKLKADAAADAKQKPRQPFPQFVLKFFEQSHGIGTKMLLKHFGMFVNGAFALIDDPRSEFHDYALTFGQMAGIHTDSGRVAAFPASASTFMLDYFVAVRPLVGLYRGDRVERSSSLEAVISKGETAAYFGYIALAAAKHASQHREKRKSRTNLDATGDIAAFAAQHAADAAASERATASFDTTQDRATASFVEGRASFASVDTAELLPKQVDAVRSLAGAVAPTKVSSARSPRPT